MTNPYSIGARPIRSSDYAVAAATWATCVSVIVAARYDRSTLPAAALRQSAGAAIAARASLMLSLAFGSAAKGIVDAAYLAGVRHEGFRAAREAMVAMPASNGLCALVQSLFVRLCLAAEARALADTEFVSRQDVDAAIVAMRDAFEAVLDYAAERHDAEVFQTFSALYGDTILDLTERARALPKMASYATPESAPALRLACRLYGDAARAGELAAENRAINPIFMPAAGRALAF